jgi:hypothetical protein
MQFGAQFLRVTPLVAQGLKKLSHTTRKSITKRDVERDAQMRASSCAVPANALRAGSAAPLRNGDLCRHCDVGQEASWKWNFANPKALVLIVISLRGHHATCPDYHCQCIASLVRLGTFHGAWLGPRHLDHGMAAGIGLARPGGKARTVRQSPGRADGFAYSYSARKTLSSGTILRRRNVRFAARRKRDMLRAGTLN